jgi:hypothetical protein
MKYKEIVKNHSLNGFYGENKMTTFEQEAKAYVPKQTKNIAELEYFSKTEELKTGEGTDKEGKPFKYKYLERDGVEYRVPGSVIGAVKLLIEKKPNLKNFQVIKSGEGLDSKYQVIPYIPDDVVEEKVN